MSIFKGHHRSMRVAGFQSAIRGRDALDTRDAFQHYRIKTATRELYPYRPFVRRLYRKTG